MNTFKTIVLVSLLLAFLPGLAQFEVSGELRPRSEFRHGYGVPAEKNQEAAFFINQRSRINMWYGNTQYEVKITLQDVRLWGSIGTISPDGGVGTSLHEAWANIKFNDKTSLKFGRQEISIAEKRLISNSGWAQQARRHDAVLFKYSHNELIFQAAASYNQSSELLSGSYYAPRGHKTMQLVNISKVFNSVEVNGTFLNLGFQGDLSNLNKTIHQQTVGVVSKYKTDKIIVRASTFGQYGTMTDGRTPIRAMLVSLDAIAPLGKYHFAGAGIEHLSGNDQFAEGVNHAFTPYFGANHGYHGNMDYFYASGRYQNSMGLNDLFLEHRYQKEQYRVTSKLHSFYTDGRLQSTERKGLGVELDLSLTYWLSDDVTFEGGFSRYFGTEVSEIILGGDRHQGSQWGWLMITIKPTFFSTKMKVLSNN